MRRNSEAADGEEADGALVRRLQAGDGAAFDALFARHRRGLLVYGRSLLGDHGLAEDLVQETFLAMVRHRDTLDPRRGVSGWLYRVARNRALDMRRQRGWEALPGPETLQGLLEAGDAGPDASVVMMAGERATAVRQALMRLQAAEREVLMLRYFSGLTAREVAEATGKPLGTVLWRTHQALGRLRAESGDGGQP